jgi:hypothetical protein
MVYFLACTQQTCYLEERRSDKNAYEKRAYLAIVACTDTNVCPVRSHVYVELPHVTHPHPLTARYWKRSLLPTPYICPLSSAHGTLLVV